MIPVHQTSGQPMWRGHSVTLDHVLPHSRQVLTSAAAACQSLAVLQMAGSQIKHTAVRQILHNLRQLILQIRKMAREAAAATKLA